MADDHLTVLYSNMSSYALQGLAKRSDLVFDPMDAKLVLTNAPSIVPSNNPGFRVYQYDVRDSKLQGWDQYWTNLNEDNTSGNITWSKEYSTAATYGVSRLDTPGWQQFMAKLKINKKIFSKYQSFLHVQSIVWSSKNKSEERDSGDDEGDDDFSKKYYDNGLCKS
jgi:hypothetical protein